MTYYYRSEMTGDGSDAEDNARVPVVAMYLNQSWWTIVERSTDHVALVETSQSLDLGKLKDPRVTEVKLEDGMPKEGKTGKELVLRVGQRYQLANILGADDFGLDLQQQFSAIPLKQRDAMVEKLAARYELHKTPSIDSVDKILRSLLPTMDVRLGPREVGKSGTFTDDFTVGSNTNLADHTPSGGTAWTLVAGDGTKTYCVASNNQLFMNGNVTSAPVCHHCDDQSSANQYVEFQLLNVDSVVRSFVTNRCADQDDYWGIRCSGSNAQLFKCVAGAFTNVGTDTTTLALGDWIRLESDGNNHDVFIDTGSGYGSSVISTTDSAHASETRQGVVNRQQTARYMCDQFEAGALGGGGGGAAKTLTLTGVGA